MAKRAALLIRCTPEEAEMIRRAAKAERRTISAYILNAISNRIHSRAALLNQTFQPRKRRAEP